VIAPQGGKTHCARGHPYDEANTGYRSADGRKFCRACQRENNRVQYTKREARVGLSGQEYTNNVVRGLAPWKPQGRTRPLLGVVQQVAEERRGYWPLTVRQILYAIDSMGYPKSKNQYVNLVYLLNRSRRSGTIPWGGIRDDGAVEAAQDGYATVEAFWGDVENWAEQYEADLTEGQERHVIVWSEHEGLVPQLKRIAHPYGATVVSGGGVDSLTIRYQQARNAVTRDVPTVVLHVGDHDFHGRAIVDVLADDLPAFCADMGEPDTIEVRRIAVTPEQIERYELAASVDDDTRIQVGALPPEQLADEVCGAIEELVDLDALEEIRERGEDERRELVAFIERIREAKE